MPDELLSVPDVVERWHQAGSTVRRHLAEGKLPNARRQGEGPSDPWAIPISDLVAHYGPEPVDPKNVAELTAQVENMRATLEEAQRAAASAKDRHEGELRRVEQQARQLVEDAKAELRADHDKAMAALVAAHDKATADLVAAHDKAMAALMAQANRSWWRRGRGRTTAL